MSFNRGKTSFFALHLALREKYFWFVSFYMHKSLLIMIINNSFKRKCAKCNYYKNLSSNLLLIYVNSLLFWHPDLEPSRTVF